MISSENYKKIRIHIRTYTENGPVITKVKNNMEEERKKLKANSNKFICSICLNSRTKDNDKKSKTLKTLSQKACSICLESSKASLRDENTLIANPTNADKQLSGTSNKCIQTSYTDLNKSLNLLNEVLTVFQNKKQSGAKTKSRTVILKDAGISTEDVGAMKPKLGISKVFQFSVDELYNNSDQTIITSHDDIVRSQHSVELPKHKSSSVPQMKLEELRNSLKEKSRSKDTIDEVNRMFATVTKVARHNTEEFNRPLVRNGPRILPVVKAKEDLKTITPSDDDDIICKCCQNRVDCMSSGDSFIRPEFCHHANVNQKCEKCVYVMCCNYKNRRKMQAGVVFCDRCTEERTFCCQHERESFGVNN